MADTMNNDDLLFADILVNDAVIPFAEFVETGQFAFEGFGFSVVQIFS